MNRKHHSAALVALLRKQLGDNVTRGAEIGINEGRTACVVLREFPSLYLFMVDPWRVWEPETVYAQTCKFGKRNQEQWCNKEREAMDRVEPYKDRTIVIRMLSIDAAQFVLDGSLDYVFIDAAHDYDAVKLDIATWTPKVRTGGVIAGHDYDAPKRERAMGQWGVKRAVDEWGDQFNYDIRISDMDSCVWWAVA